MLSARVPCMAKIRVCRLIVDRLVQKEKGAHEFYIPMYSFHLITLLFIAAE